MPPLPAAKARCSSSTRSNQTIKPIYNSPTALDCENPDNLTVTPRGGPLMCENNSGSTPNDAERLIGLTLTHQRSKVRI